MFDDEEEDGGYFLLVLGVLAAVLVIVSVVALGDDDLPAPTVTGEAPVEEVEEVEETTTTTEAPATTTTTEAPTTTTEAPAAEPVTMWDALNDSGGAQQFALIGGALGLQADLEALVDADGNPVERTLFAPSDAALAALGSEAIGNISADADAANALVGYHFLEGVYTAEDLIALDGETVQTRTGLPLRINVVDGQVVLNDVAVVSSADFGSDNGVVHIIEAVLQPPTLNSVLELGDIEFQVSSAVITPEGEEVLQTAVAFFLENEGVNAAIEGHTDTDGGEEGNLALSQARAESVLAYMVANGLDAERFTATGFGETRPILVDGVEDKAASRRIEFNVR